MVVDRDPGGVTWTLHHGDCRAVLATMDDASVDAVVTDPPYELGFMGKAWDAAGVAYDRDLWAEVLRVLKPGGHLLAFGGTRTYHRMACAIEDAGFEVRDSIHWLYGSGFPKSLDVSKAIDKAAGAEREVVGTGISGPAAIWSEGGMGNYPITAPATDAAREWSGWGTALKPAHEPIVVARKPLVGTVAATVLAHGTGALNIDGCRVGGDAGRWPANFVLTHAADCGDACAPGCPVAELDAQSGARRSAGDYPSDAETAGMFGTRKQGRLYNDTGGASRFFPTFEWDDDIDPPFLYEPKASSAERNDGVDGRNHHPTVKPVALMRWLVRLVTPPGGVVLDPFAGSGTTLAAAILEGFDCVGVEMTDDYLPIIEGRCAWAERQARFGPVTGPTKVTPDDGTPSLFDEGAA